MQYIKEKLSILTGNLPLPSDPTKRIRNRSVTYPDIDDRELAVQFLSHELESLNIEYTIQRFTKILKDSETGEEYEIPFANIIADIPSGSSDQADLVVIGAHYDVQNSYSGCWRGNRDEYAVTQGADDNGSGAICCLELARRFKQNPLSGPVRIVFFDGEEPGHFTKYLGYGSQYFCQHFDMEAQKIRLAYIIDMIGGPIIDQEIGFTIGTVNLEGDLSTACDEVIDHFGNKFGASVLGKRNSMNCYRYTDSAYFAAMGVSTTILSNTAGFDTLPSFYHTEHDTLDVIDWESFLYAIDISEALLRREDWF